MTKPNMLFLCADNTCRSPIAEALARHVAGDRCDVRSAGFAPGSELHPLARRVLVERGISTDGLRPRGYRASIGRDRIDVAVVLCADAGDDAPDSWPGGTTRFVWSVPDPTEVGGTELERLAAFRRIRDDIESHIRRWLADPDIAWA
jgi:arsenate reductase (thioredoxin)